MRYVRCTTSFSVLIHRARLGRKGGDVWFGGQGVVNNRFCKDQPGSKRGDIWPLCSCDRVKRVRGNRGGGRQRWNKCVIFPPHQTARNSFHIFLPHFQELRGDAQWGSLASRFFPFSKICPECNMPYFDRNYFFILRPPAWGGGPSLTRRLRRRKRSLRWARKSSRPPLPGGPPPTLLVFNQSPCFVHPPWSDPWACSAEPGVKPGFDGAVGCPSAHAYLRSLSNPPAFFCHRGGGWASRGDT